MPSRPCNPAPTSSTSKPRAFANSAPQQLGQHRPAHHCQRQARSRCSRGHRRGGHCQAVQTSNSATRQSSPGRNQDLPIVGSRADAIRSISSSPAGVVSGAPTMAAYVHSPRPLLELYPRRHRRQRFQPGRQQHHLLRINPDSSTKCAFCGNNTPRMAATKRPVAMVTLRLQRLPRRRLLVLSRPPQRQRVEKPRQSRESAAPAEYLRRRHPIVKNKTFFFGQVQALRARSSRAITPGLYRHRPRGLTLRQAVAISRRILHRFSRCAGNPCRPEHQNNMARAIPAHRPRPTIQAIKNRPRQLRLRLRCGLNTAGYLQRQASSQHDQTISSITF
jgi:hypothetical protein